MKIFEILEELACISSSNDKIAIIAKHKDNKYFTEVLKMTYDKISTNYYVKKGWDFGGARGLLSIDTEDGIKEIREMLNSLATRQQTGHDALDLVSGVGYTFNEQDQDIIEKILGRDLKCGFSEGSINKAIKGLIPVFDVALAKSYDDHSKKVWDGGEWVISRKIDGLRMIAIRDGDTFNFFSRKGKPFNTMNNLIPDLLKISGNNKNIVFDGEVALVDEKGNEDFTGISSEYNKKNHTMENPKYLLFDCLSKEEFYEGKSERTTKQRLEELNTLFNTDIEDYKHLKVLEQIPLSEDSFSKLQKQVKSDKWEGLMLRRIDVPYKGKRTDHLLKVKTFFDTEYKVIETINGPFAYSEAGQGQKEEDMMTAVIVEHKGHKVQVGSGWSIEQRRDFYKNPEKIIGKEITVSYFEETTNKQGTISLRFPTLKAVYDGKRMV